MLPPDHLQGDHHTDQLGCHRGNGCAPGAHTEARHQEKIPRDVADAGDQHRHEGRAGIPDAAEDASDQII